MSDTSRVDRINGLVGSIAVKAPCKVATTGNITLSGAQTINGIALTADASPRQRVLVKDQTNAVENGIYDVNSGAWTRSPDFDGDRDAVKGTHIIVIEGSAPFGRMYYLSNENPVSIGTDSLSFAVSSFGNSIVDTSSFLFLSDYSCDLAAAVSDIGSTITTLIVDCDAVLSSGSTVTTPQTLSLNIIKGGSIDGVSGGGTETLTINGPLIAGRYQIFGSNLTVNGSPLVNEIYPEWFGENTTPGTTDMIEEITAALSLASSSTCKIVDLGEDTYGVSSTIDIPDGVKFIGKGGGQYPAAAFVASANFIALPKTRLVALAGFAGSTYVIDVTQSAGALYAKQAVEVSGMMIDCASIAEYGMRVRTVKNSKFNDILVFRPTVLGIIEDVLSVADAVTEGNNATQFNEWDQITVWAGNTGTAVGWRQDGTASHNINQNSYRNIQIIHADGTGIDFENADTNSYYRLSTYAFGIGYGAVFHGDDVAAADFARSLKFYDVLFGGASAGGNSGTAQAGAATTITLAAGASSTDDYYNDKLITLDGGTGDGQTRIITDYDGTTKVATVAAWGTTPDATTTYTIPSGGGCHVKSGSVVSSKDHIAYGYQETTNGAKDPVVDAGCGFTWYGERESEIQNPSIPTKTITDSGTYGTGNSGSYNFKARIGDNSIQDVAGIQATAQGASGSEAFRLDFLTWLSGAKASRAYIGNGLVVGSPTGGDKGAGTINAVAVYDDNVLLTDYVFQAWLEGYVDIERWDSKPAERFASELWQFDIDKWSNFLIENQHLPAMQSEAEYEKDGNLSTGDKIQRLEETIEVQAIHIINLNERLKKLEGKQ